MHWSRVGRSARHRHSSGRFAPVCTVQQPRVLDLFITAHSPQEIRPAIRSLLLTPRGQEIAPHTPVRGFHSPLRLLCLLLAASRMPCFRDPMMNARAFTSCTPIFSYLFCFSFCYRYYQPFSTFFLLFASSPRHVLKCRKKRCLNGRWREK